MRELYAQRLRARYEHRPLFWSHHRRRVELLEAGEPVVLHWWELAPLVSGVRHPDRGGVAEFVRLQPDGSVEFVEPVKDGAEIVDWRPVHLGPRR
ncbi:hypothetical protein [Pseudonocardia sp. H11422]|uniref:hypothetical protein n=1 Tax=Pseudonocardia sp. H11422 TaxID=2835866 RepID=UPI001BDCE454|nr:hypothetical protein [Pseudonocardia sp. H11422]